MRGRCRPRRKTQPPLRLLLPDPLQSLNERWQQLPAKMTLASLTGNPELTQTQIELIYDTEIVTRQVCGAPTGDDDLLLKIAQAPNQVEEE